MAKKGVNKIVTPISIVLNYNKKSPVNVEEIADQKKVDDLG